MSDPAEFSNPGEAMRLILKLVEIEECVGGRDSITIRVEGSYCVPLLRVVRES